MSLQAAPACIRHLEAVGKSPSRETGGMQALRALHPPERSVRGVVVQGGGCYAMCKHDRPWLDGQKWAKKGFALGTYFGSGYFEAWSLGSTAGGQLSRSFLLFFLFSIYLGGGGRGVHGPLCPTANANQLIAISISMLQKKMPFSGHFAWLPISGLEDIYGHMIVCSCGVLCTIWNSVQRS